MFWFSYVYTTDSINIYCFFFVLFFCFFFVVVVVVVVVVLLFFVVVVFCCCFFLMAKTGQHWRLKCAEKKLTPFTKMLLPSPLVYIHCPPALTHSLIFKLYWTKFITQLVNGPISVWLCGVGQSIADILLNYSQRIFGAEWAASLQPGSLSSNLIGQNGFYVPGACQGVRNFKLFNISYSNVRSIRWGLSLENPLLKFHKI